MKWLRRRPQYRPREAWVVLVDRAGNEVSIRHPVVVNCDPQVFEVEHAIDPKMLRAGHVAAVRVIDADGKHYDQPLA